MMLSVELLFSFVAVAETASFTQAAERSNQTQSSISQQIGRLEKRVGCTLIERTTHQVRLTENGRKLLVHARMILRAVNDAEFALSQPELSGSIRLGLAEDFASTRLPEILGRFRRTHPAIRLQVETGLSAVLFERLDRGEFDLVFAKRPPRSSRGELLIQEPLVWAGGPGSADLALQRPLPLALHPAPSVTRSLVLKALTEASIEYVEVLNSPSVSAVRAGALASLGVTAFGRHFIPETLTILSAETDLPLLPNLEFVLERRPQATEPAVEALIALLQNQHCCLAL